MEMGCHSFYLHISRGLSWAERAGLLCVCTKDRARTNMRQIVQNDDKSKQSLGGGYVVTNYIFAFKTEEEKNKNLIGK